MSANPHTNGGLLLKDLRLPDFREYAVRIPGPGVLEAESTRVMGTFLRDTMKLNLGVGISASSVRTKTTRIAGKTSWTPPTGRGWLSAFRMTIIWRRMEG